LEPYWQTSENSTQEKFEEFNFFQVLLDENRVVKVYFFFLRGAYTTIEGQGTEYPRVMGVNPGEVPAPLRGQAPCSEIATNTYRVVAAWSLPDLMVT